MYKSVVWQPVGCWTNRFNIWQKKKKKKKQLNFTVAMHYKRNTSSPNRCIWCNAKTGWITTSPHDYVTPVATRSSSGGINSSSEVRTIQMCLVFSPRKSPAYFMLLDETAIFLQTRVKRCRIRVSCYLIPKSSRFLLVHKTEVEVRLDKRGAKMKVTHTGRKCVLSLSLRLVRTLGLRKQKSIVFRCLPYRGGRLWD